MINKGAKALAGAVFAAFIFFEAVTMLFGEAIVMGYRILGEAVWAYAIIAIAASALSMIMIFRDRALGYLVLGLSVTVVLIVYFGHRIFWWPCEYCSL